MSQEIPSPQEPYKPDDSDTVGEVIEVPKKKKKSYFTPIFIGIILAVIVNIFFLRSYVVPSGSMDPTLQTGDYMMSVPLLENLNPPERGDIIVFDAPEAWKNAPEVFVKRVIGVAGDHLEYDFRTGELLINGEVQDEPYVKQWKKTTFLDAGGWEFTVPEDSLFVMGDNRDNSRDSRFYEDAPFVPVENVLGKPFLLTWPLDRMHLLHTQ